MEQCTNSTDVTCQTCQANINPTAIAYERSPDWKTCVSRCSWLNNWCWPGYCTGSEYAADRCTCAPGFSGSPKCLIITSNATVLVLNVSISDNGNKYSANFTYLNGSSWSTVYSRFKPDLLVVTLKAHFGVPQLGSQTFNMMRWKTDYRMHKNPPWIPEYRFGITGASITLESFNSFTRKSRVLDQSELQCSYLGENVTLSSSFSYSPVDCMFTYDLSGQQFSHGDKLNVDINIANGGHIVIKDMSSPRRHTTTHYYSGTSRRVTAPFLFDYVAPFHCSVNSNIGCPTGITASNMLSVGDTPVTKRNQLTVSWDGWFDSIGGSGVKKYVLEIYHMELTHNGLSEKPVPFFRRSFSAFVTKHAIILTQSGLFSVVLYVYDAAENFRIARRFVLYDEPSKVALDRRRPLSFPKAVQFGNLLWKTGANGSVLIDWKGHFYNTLIKEEPLLQSISSFRQTIDNGYDGKTTGLLGLKGTLNYAGIVGYKYAVSYGLNPQQPDDLDFQDVPKAATSLLQHHVILTATTDGDHITVWIKGIDIWGNTAIDKAMIHVDLSGPAVSNFGFIWGQRPETRVRLQFMNLYGLHRVQVAFDLYDPHSGVAMAIWKLGETDGGSEIGKGRLSTKAKSQFDCHPSNCSCNSLHICSHVSYSLNFHIGHSFHGSETHPHTYYFTVYAENNAQMSSSVKVPITVALHQHVACISCSFFGG